MNERIKELAEQATSIVESPPNREGWTSSYAYFDKEKFAELIVRECDRYVAEHYDEMEPWMQPGDLLEHFGVEE